MSVPHKYLALGVLAWLIGMLGMFLFDGGYKDFGFVIGCLSLLILFYAIFRGQASFFKMLKDKNKSKGTGEKF